MSAHSKSSTKTAGRYSRRVRKANGPPAGEGFGWLTWSLMDSAAYRALSHSGRIVLDRIHREHGAQGGKENGRLKVTWRDFQKAGVQPRRITRAVAEVEALGLAIRTYYGRRACGEDRGASAQFRLTWLPVMEPDNLTPATNEWKRFGDDIGGAKRIAKSAAGRTMVQRERESMLVTPGQNIEGATTRGVQKKGARRIQRGVQILHSTGGAEKKDFEADFAVSGSEALH